MSKYPMKLRVLLKKLAIYDVVPMGKSDSGKGKRGKGSEIILLLPESVGSKKGLTYPIKDHGLGTEISIPVIKAFLRRFNIDQDEFWD